MRKAANVRKSSQSKQSNKKVMTEFRTWQEKQLPVTASQSLECPLHEHAAQPSTLRCTRAHNCSAERMQVPLCAVKPLAHCSQCTPAAMQSSEVRAQNWILQTSTVRSHLCRQCKRSTLQSKHRRARSSDRCSCTADTRRQKARCHLHNAFAILRRKSRAHSRMERRVRSARLQ